MTAASAASLSSSGDAFSAASAKALAVGFGSASTADCIPSPEVSALADVVVLKAFV
jgi:hypothetical protein